MSQGDSTDDTSLVTLNDENDENEVQIRLPRKVDLKRRLSLKDILPMCVNEVVEPELDAFPRLSFSRQKGPGYVYVLQEAEEKEVAKDKSYYKAGVTNDLTKRLRELQNDDEVVEVYQKLFPPVKLCCEGNPRPLILTHVIRVEQMSEAEKQITPSLKPHITGGGGGKEWYSCDRKCLSDVIEKVKATVQGMEISPDKYNDYMQYFIKFE